MSNHIDPVRTYIKALELALEPLEKELRAEDYTPGHNAIGEVLNALEELKDILDRMEDGPPDSYYEDFADDAERSHYAEQNLRETGRR